MENLTNIEQQRFERAAKRVKSIAGFYKHLIIYVLVNIFLIIVKYCSLEGDEQFFQFSTFSTAFFWGIGLLFHGMGVFGSAVFLGKDWEERKIQQILNKNNKGQKWE